MPLELARAHRVDTPPRCDHPRLADLLVADLHAVLPSCSIVAGAGRGEVVVTRRAARTGPRPSAVHELDPEASDRPLVDAERRAGSRGRERIERGPVVRDPHLAARRIARLERKLELDLRRLTASLEAVMDHVREHLVERHLDRPGDRPRHPLLGPEALERVEGGLDALVRRRDARRRVCPALTGPPSAVRGRRRGA